MAGREIHEDGKAGALKKYHALNPHPEKVKDEEFTSGPPFFDSRDLVQVKYEMLRGVEEEKRSITDAARAFGFSRPTFYKTRRSFESEGFAGLLPEVPGPKRSHKLSDEVMDFVEKVRHEQGPVSSTVLARLILERFGVSVHPRSVERAMLRRQKKRL